MQTSAASLTTSSSSATSAYPQTGSPLPAARMDAPSAPVWQSFHVIRRNGGVMGFEPAKIAIAMTKAFLAVSGSHGAVSARIRELVEQLTEQVVSALVRNRPSGGTFHIEDIQDQVELSLMRSGEHDVARAYVLYREKRAQKRAQAKTGAHPTAQPSSLQVKDNGTVRPLDLAHLRQTIAQAATGHGEAIDVDAILTETLKNLYDGVPLEEVYKSAILAARALVETDPAYSFVTAGLLLHTIRSEVLGEEVAQQDMACRDGTPGRYAQYFPDFIKLGIQHGLLNPQLAQYDLTKLGQALKAERDHQFNYLGLQTLGLPLPMGGLAALAVIVTSATIVAFGESIWDPVTVAGKMTGAAVLLSLIVLLIDTISVNLAANLVGPAFDFSALSPKRISYRMGGFITAGIGLVMMPWKVLESTHGYIFTWLIGYSALLGPIAGILLADYWFLRRTRLNVPQLYENNGEYSYSNGWNRAALIAFILGALPNLPGFLHAAFPATFSAEVIPAFFIQLYTYAWFAGAALGFVLYLLLMKLRGQD